MMTDTLTTDGLPSQQDTAKSSSKSFPRHLPTAARILMGAAFLLFGITGLLGMTPPPPPTLPKAAIAFNDGMMKTGYMMPLIFATQAVTGALLLSNRFVPLALALIAPFLVNSFAFHAFLVPEGLAIVVILVALELYLAWSYRAAFLPMLTMRVKPST